MYKFDKVRHYHSYEGRPLVGTSGVVNVVAKPLNWWVSGLAVQVLGIPDPKVLTKIKNGKANPTEVTELMKALSIKKSLIAGMTDQEYFKLLDSAYRAHQTTLSDKAEEGTDLHAELERFVKDQIEGITEPIKKYHPRITPFIIWYNQNVKEPLWSETHCYSTTHWLGGISDFGFIDKQGLIGIMDFKSSKTAYPTQFWQCAGYDIQITENGGHSSSGDKIFTLPAPINYYAIFPFGAENPAPIFEFDTEGCKAAFLACLLLHNKLPTN